MSFKVSVPASGHEFDVEPCETILDAALRQGIGLPYGCRNGACGKCAGELLSGEITYAKKLSSLALDQQRQGKTLFCQACPTSDIEIKVREISTSRDIEIKTLPCRVETKELLTHDIMKLELKLPETERLQFLAGQYIEFLLKDGKRRAYSIANAPHDDACIELHIRHVPDGQFGDYVFDGMKVKELFRIEGPLGNYYLREDSDRPIIMMGGGTCGVRARKDLYMDDMVKGWLKQHDNLKYTPVLSEPEAGDNWQGKTGFVHEAIIEEYPDLSGYDVYMSGPPPMIKAGMDAFYAHGLPESQIYSDSFEYSDDALRAMGITKPQA